MYVILRRRKKKTPLTYQDKRHYFSREDRLCCKVSQAPGKREQKRALNLRRRVHP